MKRLILPLPALVGFLLSMGLASVGQAVEILRMMAGKGELDPNTVEHVNQAFASPAPPA